MFFGYQNGSKLVPKWDPKLISTLKAEKQLNASRLAFSWFSGVEVGSKNRPKIDLKMESKMECILASIFKLLWSIFGTKLGWKMEQKSIKNGIEKTIEKKGQQDGCLGRPRVRDVQQTNATQARRGRRRDPWLPGWPISKDNLTNRPALRRSDTPWASGPANLILVSH